MTNETELKSVEATPNSPLGIIRASRVRIKDMIKALSEEQHAIGAKQASVRTQIAALSADSTADKFAQVAADQMAVNTFESETERVGQRITELMQRHKELGQDENRELGSTHYALATVRNARVQLAAILEQARLTILSSTGIVLADEEM